MKDHWAKLIAILLWLTIDVGWIIFANSIKFPYYRAIKAVQNNEAGVTGSVRGGIVAYFGMIISWLVLVADRAQEGDEREEYALAGMALGFGLYSTFNGTNNFMFEGWGSVVSFIDTLWGTFATTLISFVYATMSEEIVN
jgi:uncharacterized membrane protein